MPLFDEHTLARLRRLRMAAGRVRRASAHGERLSRQFGSGQEFAQHRAYSHGDDLRRVDWNVYGRLGQLFVKLFEQPGQLRVLLVADDSPTMDFGEHNKWLAARRVLGAIGLIALAGSERVLLSRLGAQQPHSFDGTGEQRFLQLLDGLPLGDAPATSVSAIRGMYEKHARDSVLLIVSDFQNRDSLIQLLREARHSGVRCIAVSIAAREELNPSLDGFTNLQPVSADGVKLRIDDRVLAAYREEVKKYREGVTRAVHAAGAAYVELNSADPIEPLLADLMRAGVLGN